MHAAIPKLDANGNFVQPTSPASILQKLQARYSLHDCDSVTFGGLEERGGYDTHTVHWTYRDYQDIIVAINKPPRWNDAVAAFVLDFAGRVTVASVKNFQLTDDIEEELSARPLLQFGRVAKDEFTMDFRHPISPVQAFAFALTSCIFKFGCE